MKVEGPRPTRPSQAQGGALDGASSTPRRLGAVPWRRPSAVAPASGGRRRRPSASAVVGGGGPGLWGGVPLWPPLLFSPGAHPERPRRVGRGLGGVRVGGGEKTAGVGGAH